MSEDTSQLVFCKNRNFKIQPITQVVNEYFAEKTLLSKGVALQSVKLFSLEAETKNSSQSRQVPLYWVLDFYPAPRSLVLGMNGQSLECSEGFSPKDYSLKNFTKPTLLYLKAHFVGQSIKSIHFENDELYIEFHSKENENFYIRWNLKEKTAVYAVPSKKEYRQTLEFLGPLSVFEKSESESKEKTKIQNPGEDKTHKRLIKNIESDIEKSEKWLSTHQKYILYFLENPVLWGNLEALDKATSEWALDRFPQIKTKVLFKETHRKEALNSLKILLNKMTRRVSGAQKRLADVKSQNQVAPKEEAQKMSIKEKAFHKKADQGPGSKVQLSDNIWAIVGRKATENDELYRKAQSRDLWFHVRGHKGAHVWVRRGQPGFGASDEASQKLLEEAALLAAKNSKAKGAWISVDYTERRFLKKRKGAAIGEVLVLQSKTLFVSL